MEKQGIKPHVAVLPSVGMGHLIPLLELGKRLALHHGFRVTLLLITTNTPPSAAQHQLLCSPDIPSDLHILKLPPVDVDQVTSHDMLIMTRLCVITEHSLIGSLKSVLVALGGLGQTRALVTDFFSTQAFDICNELSIPAYLFCTTCIAFSAFALYLPKLDSDVVEGEFIDLPEPIEVPGCSPVRTEDLLGQVRNRKSDEYKWFYFHVSRMPLASGILVNSWEELEPVSLKAIKENPYFKHIPTPPVYPVGPLIKQQETLSRVDVECLEWLDKQPPDSVLFVALGSGGTLSLEQQNELAMGLELSQQRFIWVVRHPTDVTASGTFFVDSVDMDDPRGYLPEGFLSRTQGVGLVVPSWGSQVAILGHPSTGGFLSHCGWNSSLESIAHGVPIITWPLYAEQRMNATMLVDDIGVALKLEKGAGGQEIARVVRMVMEGEQGQVIRNRAKQLKQSAAKAVDIMNGSSHHSLSFVSNLWKTTYI
ncbi:UDP-glucuronosyl/UDP-glucosyltransferase [Corchorus capsularis]|uniref:Glycosyltransferase n=1 Tax=Corchorus capsularis TaxID=210143 RepID=A0A1R3J5S7_COCAP|nr:UDP-glucuronosyl/UDP-glucosyltransferase [Corchorus capsularis]